jgi:DNA polymerase I-like protein with 3'-5' exonuclease and polymerase domains
MRFDSEGLWWEDKPVEGRASAVARPLPPIPETGWRPPEEFPNLSSADLIAIDLETKDLQLSEKGSGALRGDAEIVGIAAGVPEGIQWYFPIRHKLGGNFAPEIVLAWARDEFCREGQPKVGARLLYDLLFLVEAGVPVTGPFYDVQVAEPLIDEHAMTYDLDRLSQVYLGEGKKGEKLYEWSSRAYGGKPTRRDQAVNIWRCPVELVGPYAEGDVDLPLRVLECQRKEIALQGLERVFDIETRLIPLLLAMKRRGVKVDIARAETVDQLLQQRLEELKKQLGGVDIWSNDSIAMYFDSRGWRYLKTKIGNPSFTAKFLEGQVSNPFCQSLLAARKLDKAQGTFVTNYILGYQLNGRIHADFNQVRSDDYGSGPGRFSSSHPNLQNIPTRDKIIGPLIRSIFVAEPPKIWRCADYSQIEYRLGVHYGTGPSAEAVRREYFTNPKTDYHQWVGEYLAIDRDQAKSINFGLVYGMSPPTLAANLGWMIEEAVRYYQLYHHRLPFVHELYQAVMRIASRRGWIKTLLGRRSRYNLWECRNRDREDPDSAPRGYGAALDKWGKGNVSRAGAHKALNNLLQGGAADVIKKAMVLLWESGVCALDLLDVPTLTVHDELDWEFEPTARAEEAWGEGAYIMEHCMDDVPLKIPLMVKAKSGANWSEAK